MKIHLISAFAMLLALCACKTTTTVEPSTTANYEVVTLPQTITTTANEKPFLLSSVPCGRCRFGTLCRFFA